MKKNKKIKSFTLIEIVVSITILSIIMVSIMTIFINSTQISRKSEINRAMQENIKNIVETISEDIRKNWIKWISNDLSVSGCNLNINTWRYINWDKLCTNINNYFLANENAWSLVRVEPSQCNSFESHCIIVKNWEPLSNSQVSIKNLKFYVSNDFWITKVTILLSFQPSIKKWIKLDLIKENKIDFETSVSIRKF